MERRRNDRGLPIFEIEGGFRKIGQGLDIGAAIKGIIAPGDAFAWDVNDAGVEYEIGFFIKKFKDVSVRDFYGETGL